MWIKHWFHQLPIAVANSTTQPVLAFSPSLWSFTLPPWILSLNKTSTYKSLSQPLLLGESVFKKEKGFNCVEFGQEIKGPQVCGKCDTWGPWQEQVQRNDGKIDRVGRRQWTVGAFSRSQILWILDFSAASTQLTILFFLPVTGEKRNRPVARVAWRVKEKLF